MNLNETFLTEKKLNELQENIDAVFLVTNATFICLMQCGFACLEAGSIRSKNVTNIMMKNILDIFISCLAFWIIGYALAYGEGSSFAGNSFWGSFQMPANKFPHWFFQFVFAATAATLVSGAAAERCNFVAYLIYSALISGLIYPIAAHWVWAPSGWLLNLGYYDFAGSGPVHLLGGACAGVAAALLGPRIGRFEGESMPGHSIPLIGIGGMILITGFIAFNGGSLGTMTSPGAGNTISIVAANTIMAGSGGAFLGFVSAKLGIIKPKSWNFSSTLNAAFTGMVSICASADDLNFLSSFIMGIIGGLIYYGFHFLMLHLKIDDPLDATAVHFGGGVWGVVAGPIFKSNGLLYIANKKNLMNFTYNIIGALAIFFWALITSLILFGTMKYFNILRVSKKEEIEGLDITKHKEQAYRIMEGWHSSNNYFMQTGTNNFKTLNTVQNYTNEGFQLEHL
ncbi:ammonium transporter, putative [Pediculus humanus corporis]|uniref:Ammonium transporter n=1 Tax=Pediculus humanus subsp. corporis TaxID=121224 RepID=E0W0J8_PEDHC|nr:ammonium transporter, putative [Pediculus humanus corporis]EEB19154.1 ammonium transporter, putative [Pediculus humanus corporis]